MQNIFKKMTLGFTLFRLLMKDSKTPFLSKMLVIIALVYLVSPVDIVYDVIPLLGQLDDIVIIPLLILAAFKIIPTSLVDKYRKSLTNRTK